MVLDAHSNLHPIGCWVVVSDLLNMLCHHVSITFNYCEYAVKESVTTLGCISIVSNLKNKTVGMSNSKIHLSHIKALSFISYRLFSCSNLNFDSRYESHRFQISIFWTTSQTMTRMVGHIARRILFVRAGQKACHS